MTASTGLDEALKLEAVYYSAQVPRDLPTLTVLGTVFDKVYFPGVYLPTSGFDQAELDKEIARIIEATRDKPTRNENLVGILKFTRYAKTLEDFCVFTGDGKIRNDNDIPPRMIDDLYKAIHGPYREGWHPMFSTNFSKAMPGSDKAKQLSAMLAIECVRLALPELPLLRPEDLMEFRADNIAALRGFRRSMLRYAGELNGKVAGVPPSEIQAATKFFVDTEIVPALDELRTKMNAPARPWYKRAVDFGRVLPKVVPSFFTMNPATIIGSILNNYAGQFFTELSAVGPN
jgi:hypothetical protein